jgi:hypothetical protein
MSLYANINLSKAQENATVTSPNLPSGKTSKSAALYAGVLAKPPSVREPVPAKEPVPDEGAPQSGDIEAEKLTETSGKPQ